MKKRKDVAYKGAHMEFYEKLQELRKQKGMTQQELAERLYVSRTAISKWESGRGYPNIESLKAIAQFYSVTLDELLSSKEAIAFAQENQKNTETHYKNLVFGFLDLCISLLWFLPFFAAKGDGAVNAVSLLGLNGIPIYLTAAYYAVVIGTVLVGVLALALQNCTVSIWSKSKTKISILLGVTAVLLFIISGQSYAAVFAFSLLIIKAFLLMRHK